MDRLRIYQSLILDKIPFLLSLQDREEHSPAFGCFDRTYWQWKFIDFCDARFQEALLTLSYVYSCTFEGNIYCRNPKLLKWIEAGFSFWGKCQHRDGSFDEAYPFERSFVATGFALFYLTEAFRLIENDISKNAREKALETFKKAGNWLLKNEEIHAFISNHRLGASCGLYNLSEFTSEKKYEDRCWGIWETVRSKQSTDGWFDEYGGADPGYLTQGIYYASVLYKRSKRTQVLESLQKALEFVKYFIHPDGTIGGEYGSRNTEFYFPGGFEILAGQSPTAEAICRKLIVPVRENKIPCAGSVDVYNIMPILNSMASGCLFYKPNGSAELLPCRANSDFTKKFNDFKILVKKKGPLYIIVGIAKGGVLKVYDSEQEKLLQSCVGVFGKIKGKTVTSQFFHGNNLETKINDAAITVKGSLVHLNYSLLSPLKMIVFRKLLLLASVAPAVSRYLKKLIVNILISKKRYTKWEFKRVICLDSKDGIRAVTQVAGMPPGALKEADIHTSCHMGSSRYYKISDLF